MMKGSNTAGGRTDMAENSTAEKPIVQISVRRLVEFILRNGDIDAGEVSGRRDQEAMLAGSRAHRKLQKAQKANYSAEVPLAVEREYDELILKIEGRADGIITDEDRVTIDEIKGMYFDVETLEEPFALHLAQAKCYAAIYAAQEELDAIAIQVTYVNLETEAIKHLVSTHQREALAAWFAELSDAYYKWAKWQVLHQRARNQSMEDMAFPFPYREGQQQLTRAVYHTIKEGNELFLMAPTGVGKTMSCIYPAVRAVGQGLGDIIFYLTAKNETLRAGEEAFRILMDRGLCYQVVRITSKEKSCPMSEVRCNPEDCPYAKGHFDRVNDAVYALLTDENVCLHDREQLLAHAEKWKVCPFEMTLDLASWCDAVLCDYNYVFDPNAKLTRFFGEGAKGDYLFLIDEVHNLVDRGREMYSASLVKEHVLAAKRIAGNEEKKLTMALDRLNKLMLAVKHELLEDDGSAPKPDEDDAKHRLMIRRGTEVLKAVPGTALEQLEYASLHALEEMQNFFQTSKDGEKKEALLEFYFELGDYCAAMQKLDEHIVPYMTEVLRPKESGQTERKHEFLVKLFCVNPASRLTECIDRGRAAVLFSATLLPIQYFRQMLSTKEDAYAVYAQSPFPKEHREILIGRDVSTRYKSRGTNLYRNIASYIQKTARAKTGNYLVFFPSYQMLRDVFEIYRSEYDDENVNWVVQSPYMSDLDREIFLEDFYEDPACSLVGFAVMGGVFSEGLDLVGTRLIGAVIVGCGLPQVSLETDVLKEYYDREGNGFEYAYVYPGMNKVEQAAGRVIRTMSDQGVILLLDDRFLNPTYQRLFPREWEHPKSCTIETVSDALEAFWNGDSSAH